MKRCNEFSSETTQPASLGVVVDAQLIQLDVEEALAFSYPQDAAHRITAARSHTLGLTPDLTGALLVHRVTAPTPTRTGLGLAPRLQEA